MNKPTMPLPVPLYPYPLRRDDGQRAVWPEGLLPGAQFVEQYRKPEQRGVAA